MSHFIAVCQLQLVFVSELIFNLPQENGEE